MIEKRFTYTTDGAVFIWDLDNNYCEIYSDTVAPEHLLATVPAHELLDMCTYVETTIYSPDLDFDPDEGVFSFE